MENSIFSKKVDAEIIFHKTHKIDKEHEYKIVACELFHDCSHLAILRIKSEKLQNRDIVIGEKFKIAFIKDAHYFTFQGEVQNVQNFDSSNTLIFIKSKTVIEKPQRRRDFRLHFFGKYKEIEYKILKMPNNSENKNQPIMLQRDYADIKEIFRNGLLMDVSASGLRIMVREILKVEGEILIKLDLIDNQVEIMGEILWVKSTLYEGNYMFEVGVSLNNLNEAEKRKISNFIYREQSKMIRTSKNRQ